MYMDSCLKPDPFLNLNVPLFSDTDPVNEKQLKKQKMRYALLRACRMLVSCQDYLRQILSQIVNTDILQAATESGMKLMLLFCHPAY